MCSFRPPLISHGIHISIKRRSHVAPTQTVHPAYVKYLQGTQMYVCMYVCVYIGHVKMEHTEDIVQCSIQIKLRIFLLKYK